MFDERGCVLLIRENYDRRRYGPPGGRIEAGESPYEAIVREVAEETGAAFEPEGIVGVYHFVYPGRPRRPWLGFAFHGRLTGEPGVPTSGEIAEVGWFDPDDLPEPITNLTRYGLGAARARRRGVYRRVDLR